MTLVLFLGSNDTSGWVPGPPAALARSDSPAPPVAAAPGNGQIIRPRHGDPSIIDVFVGKMRPAGDDKKKARRPVRKTVRSRVKPAPVLATSRPDQIIVSGLTADQVTALAELGMTVISRHPLAMEGTEIVKLKPPAGPGLADTQTAIRRLAPDATVDINHLYKTGEAVGCGGKPCVVPDILGWPAAAGTTGTCRSGGIAVGLIDSAIDLSHPTFHNSWIEVVRLDPTSTTSSNNAHGTAIASLLAGTGSMGTPGLLPEGRLVAIDVFGPDQRAEAYDLIRAVNMLAAEGVSVINMSLYGPDNIVLAKTIRKAAEKRLIITAAAGNEGSAAKPVYPAGYDGVVAVTAVDGTKQPYSRANHGDYIDLAAPGVGVWTAIPGGGAAQRTGTSYAVPFVTAAVALARANAVDQSDIVGGLTSIAEDLGAPGKDPVFGQGLLSGRNLCPLTNAQAP